PGSDPPPLANAPGDPPPQVPPPPPRQAEPERALGLPRDPALLEQRPRRSAERRVAEPLLVRRRGLVERLEHAGAQAVVAAPPLGHRDAGASRQHLDRLEEADLLGLLDELEHVAAGFAPEAVVELPLGVHRERRRLLLVERAAADEVPAHPLQGHGLGDDLDDVARRAHALDPVVAAARALARGPAARAARLRAPAPRGVAGSPAEPWIERHRSLATVTPRPPSCPSPQR